jgi:hypothetical protein
VSLRAQDVRRALSDAQKRVDIALELLGERNEVIEQLEEDIQASRAGIRLTKSGMGMIFIPSHGGRGGEKAKLPHRNPKMARH